MLTKHFILSCMVIGILTSGVCSNVLAVNQTEQSAENQQIQERVLTKEDVKKLIAEMRAKGSTELVIPDDFTSIAGWAFYGCTELTSVTIPDSVTSIDCWAFNGCNKTEFIVASEAMKNYISSGHKIRGSRITVDTALYTPENAWKWPEDGHVKIPENIKVISDSMFSNRRDIKFVTIHDSVTSIGECAFSGCNKLEHIYVYSEDARHLAIKSNSDIDPNIIHVIEKPKQDVSDDPYTQVCTDLEQEIAQLDYEINQLLSNNPVAQERQKMRQEIERGYGWELDGDSAMFDDSKYYESSRPAYVTYKRRQELEKIAAKKRQQLDQIKMSLNRRQGNK